MNVFGIICILAFVLLETASATNNTTTAAPTTTAASNVTTAAASNVTTAAAPTTIATTALPTTQPTPDEDVTTNQSRIDMKTRVTSRNYSEIHNLTTEAGKTFKKEFEDVLFEIIKVIFKALIRVVIRAISPGSVIVDYYLVLNTTSETEAAKIANAVTEVIKSGKIGNFTTDPNYKTDAYIVRKVKVSDVSPAPDPTTTTVSTMLLIVLGAALFILLVIIIILVVLVVFLMKLKKKGEKQ